MLTRTFLGCSLVLVGCGPAPAAVTPTSANPAVESHVFKGEECHAVWQKPKDAKGRELPYESTEGVSTAWAKGSALPADGKNEQAVLGVICFAALGSTADDTFRRYARFDDRRFDVNEAAVLVDECVESGVCTHDPTWAGMLAPYAHELVETRLSASSRSLEISQEARDALVDRTLVNVKALDDFLATIPAAQRAYAVDVPKAVHDRTSAYFKERTDDYSHLDRMLGQPTGNGLVVQRSDAAARCGTAQKCAMDPMYRELWRDVVHFYVAGKQPLEAKAAELVLGPMHASRGRTASAVWASQMAFRKVHAEVSAPPPVTEEGPDETASLPMGDVQVVRGVVTTVAPAGKGLAKITFKDAPAGVQQCEDTTDIDGYDGPIEQTRVVYKKKCSPLAGKPDPFTVTADDVTAVKPGMVVVAAVSGTGAARKGIVAQVIAGDVVMQLGPDKFLSTSGDPLK